MKGIVFSADKNLIITNVNPAWQTITGYKFLVNKKTKIIDYIVDEEIKNQIQLFLIDPSKTELQVRFKLKAAKSKLKWVEGFIFKHDPVLDDNSLVWGILNDIDDQIRNEENLVNQIIKEKELNELKSRFVNMVSHEVRTPLAGILSSVELLEIINYNTLQELKEKNNRHFGRIKDQISKIGELMNDVLLLGKIESGTVEVKLVEIDLVTKIQDFLNENFGPESSKRKIVFKVKGQNKNISLDWKLMYHVLTNLISNALKYSVGKPDPEIELIFREDVLSIFIKDYGIGIPKNDVDKLFVPFRRGSNVAGINGTGLGLVLVKYFVKLHNGTIQLMSEIGKGTNIEITLKY
jgi:signal transduction histidine kinase